MPTPAFYSRVTLVLLLVLFLGGTPVFAQPDNTSPKGPRYNVVKDNIACLYGIKNASGKWVVPAAYTSIDRTAAGYFIISSGSYQGLLDTNARQLIPPVYNEIWQGDGIYRPYAFISGTSYGMSHNLEFSDADADDLFYVRKDHHVGLADRSGQLRLDTVWATITLLQKDRFMVMNHESLFGLADNTGKLLLPAKYNLIERDGNERYFITEKKRHGLADKNGKILIEPKYIALNRSGLEGFYLATGLKDERNSASGIVNIKGDTIIPIKYDLVWICNDGFGVRRDGLTGYYDKEGKLLQAVEYEMQENAPCFSRYSYGKLLRPQLVASQNKKTGVLKSYGQWLIAPEYDSIDGRESERGVYMIKAKGKWGVADTTGKIIIPPLYDKLYMTGFQDKARGYTFYWKVRLDGKYGLIREDGSMILPAEYEQVISRSIDWLDKKNHSHKNECLLLKRNQRYGLALYDGQTIEPCIHDSLIYSDVSGLPEMVLFRDGKTLKAFILRDSIPYEQKQFHYLCQVDAYHLVYIIDGQNMLVMNTSPAKKSIPQSVCHDRVATETGFDYKVCRFDQSWFILSTENRPWMTASQIENITFGVNNYPYSKMKNIPVLLTTRSGKSGLLDHHKMGFMIDTTFESVSPTPGPGETFWVKPKLMRKHCKASQTYKREKYRMPGTYLRRLLHRQRYRKMPEATTCWCGWALADSTGKLLTKPVFATPFEIKEPGKENLFPEWGNNGVGLFSKNSLKFVTPAVYRGIRKLSDNLYGVYTYGDHYGVMDSTGHLLADTTWDDCTFIFNHQLARYKYNARYQSVNTTEYTGLKNQPDLWLLKNKQGKAIISADGKLIADSARVDSLRRWAFFPAPEKDSLYSYDTPIIQKFDRQPDCDSIASKRIITHALHEIVAYDDRQLHCPLFTFLDRDCHCRNSSQTNRVGDQEIKSDCMTPKLVYELREMSRQGYSIRIQGKTPNRSYSSHDPPDVFLNYRSGTNGFSRITFATLFKGDTLAAINELMKEAIKARDDLNLDCAKIDHLFDLTSKQFLLTEKGLLLFFYHAEGPPPDLNALRDQLLIPWEKMRPYAKEGSAVFDHIAK